MLGLAILLGGLTARSLPPGRGWPQALLPLGTGMLLLLAIGLGRPGRG
ncbi:MAG: hypothetical protein ACH37Z_17650 [Anaerolineae bacterium]|nr:hypothetical protein [Ardenticatenia bacterium]